MKQLSILQIIIKKKQHKNKFYIKIYIKIKNVIYVIKKIKLLYKYANAKEVKCANNAF